ncbi:hypothetical protein C7974DRAFT_375006 [Boeremia exigua]|uniref:uncharacterized protein n=1 Tax=Boeremia exigua TaxID=749465 RepID=UPI001E8D4937|nr:uncharacterized protein C7974DRAFT_375006 [Boeremia exigua]KAH6638474.1 hypothetical protein C7974DRAFT_375006 [Boeremia exigua]
MASRSSNSVGGLQNIQYDLLSGGDLFVLFKSYTYDPREWFHIPSTRLRRAPKDIVLPRYASYDHESMVRFFQEHDIEDGSYRAEQLHSYYPYNISADGKILNPPLKSISEEMREALRAAHERCVQLQGLYRGHSAYVPPQAPRYDRIMEATDRLTRSQIQVKKVAILSAEEQVDEVVAKTTKLSADMSAYASRMMKLNDSHKREIARLRKSHAVQGKALREALEKKSSQLEEDLEDE